METSIDINKNKTEDSCRSHTDTGAENTPLPEADYYQCGKAHIIQRLQKQVRARVAFRQRDILYRQTYCPYVHGKDQHLCHTESGQEFAGIKGDCQLGQEQQKERQKGGDDQECDFYLAVDNLVEGKIQAACT